MDLNLQNSKVGKYPSVYIGDQLDLNTKKGQVETLA